MKEHGNYVPKKAWNRLFELLGFISVVNKISLVQTFNTGLISNKQKRKIPMVIIFNLILLASVWMKRHSKQVPHKTTGKVEWILKIVQYQELFVI